MGSPRAYMCSMLFQEVSLNLPQYYLEDSGIMDPEEPSKRS